MPAPGSLLGAVLVTCSREEGGVRGLARAVGMSPQTCYDLIAGKRQPMLHLSRSIARYLGITPKAVLAWSRLGPDETDAAVDEDGPLEPWDGEPRTVEELVRSILPPLK